METTIFDKIGSLIPGYKGYAERDGRRNCDKILRDSVASTLSQAEKELNLTLKQLIKLKETEKAEALEELRKQTNTLISKVKFAPYGVSSYFADNQIKEEELGLIYQFDLDLAEVSHSLIQLANKDQSESYGVALNHLESILLNRNNYIDEFK